MKKFIIICLIFIFSVLAVNLLTITNKNVYADSINCICVNGVGEICVTPDFAKINVGLQDTSNSFGDGQNKINNLYNNLSSAVSTLDENINVYVNYSSCYPSYDNKDVYLVNANITIETSNLELIDKIISTAGDNGATSFYGVSYSISNIKDLYDQAIEKAMEDALSKATSINKDVTLVCVNNVDVYSYCEGEKNSCVTIHASIRAKYCLTENVNNNEENETEQDYEENETQIQTKDIATYPAYCI